MDEMTRLRQRVEELEALLAKALKVVRLAAYYKLAGQISDALSRGVRHEAQA